MIMISKAFPNAICNLSPKGTCYFLTPCDQVSMQETEIEFFIGDAQTQSSSLKFQLKDILISGTLVGDSHSTCYLPVFKSERSAQDVWLMGTMFMSKYYVVLDYSPSVLNE